MVKKEERLIHREIVSEQATEAIDSNLPIEG